MLGRIVLSTAFSGIHVTTNVKLRNVMYVSTYVNGSCLLPV